jgi:hypothetical protein
VVTFGLVAEVRSRTEGDIGASTRYPGFAVNETREAFRARWNEVNAVQNEELRRLSPADRFLQLEQLFAFRRTLPADAANDERDVNRVRRRWMKLHRRLRGTP